MIPRNSLEFFQSSCFKEPIWQLLLGKQSWRVFCSTDAVARKYQNNCLEKFEKALRKKSVLVCFLLFYQPKHFIMDSFLVISNISEQLFQGTPSDDCFLKIFFHGSSRPKVLEKLLWKIWGISEENVCWNKYFLFLASKTTLSLIVSWELWKMF